MKDDIELDMLVIGAGISGIFASKFYLDIHPDIRLLILDQDNCIGGTWNSRRGYDEFWTQWTVGTAEFSDQPMPRPPDEDLYLEFFKAKHTTNYLESYADCHRYSGKTLRDRIKLSSKVKSIMKAAGAWTILTEDLITGVEQIYITTKLVVASGLTSIANMPCLPGRENFSGQILHHEDFGSSNVLTSPDIQNITILGAGKSSADMAYEAVKAGKTVSWVLKATNTTGPGFFLSPKGIGPYKNAFEIGMTRIAATFTPSFLNGSNWWTKLINSTNYGAKIMNAFWNKVDGDARKEARFDRPSLQGFENLEPHSTIFWQNCTGGLLNHEDFFDIMADKVRIYCGDLDFLDEKSVHLKSDEEISSDAILCGTGWVPSLQFLSGNQCSELGVPHPSSQESMEQKSRWAELEEEADVKVLATFPQLSRPPPHYHKPVTHTPYRLYRLIAPLSESRMTEKEDRSIVFIGHIGVGNYFPAVECQMMWATAYLDGKLKLPSAIDQEKEVALFTSWCRRRYLSNGDEGNNLTFELIGYTDTLLQDLGLRSHRKSWFKDFFAPCWASDFKGLKAEFIDKYRYETSGK